MHLSPSIGHDLVTGTRFMGAFTMFALSILLAFVNRGKTQLQVYDPARGLIFTGCLLLGIFNLVQFLGNFREQSITLSWAITTMFLVAIIPPSPSENVSWMHIIEGRTAIATPLKPI